MNTLSPGSRTYPLPAEEEEPELIVTFPVFDGSACKLTPANTFVDPIALGVFESVTVYPKRFDGWIDSCTYTFLPYGISGFEFGHVNPPYEPSV